MNMHSSSPSKDPTSVGLVLTTMGVIAGILLFAFVMAFVYLPKRPRPVDANIVEQRLARLAEVNAKEKELISGYAWVDQPAGIVRIPVERSMEIVVEKVRAGQPLYVAPAPVVAK